MEFRPSQLPRLDKCPASKKQPTVDIQRSFAAQKQGNAVHEMLSIYFTESDPAKKLNFSEIVLKEGIENLNELYRNFWSAVRYLESLEGIEIIGVEKKLKSNHHITFDGTCDILFIFDGELYVLDWKTGRVERCYKKQLEAYLVLACEELGFKKGHIIEYYTQTGSPYMASYREGFIETFYENLERIAVSNSYDPGEHCEFCPLFWECEARQVMLKGTLKMITDSSDDLQGNVSQEKLIELYNSSNAILGIIENFKNLFKNEIIMNGSLKNETHEYTYPEVKMRSVLFNKALPELVALGVPNMQDLKDELTLGSTKFQDFLKKNTPLGKAKGKYIAEVMEHLEKHGALAISYQNKTTKKKIK